MNQVSAVYSVDMAVLNGGLWDQTPRNGDLKTFSTNSACLHTQYILLTSDVSRLIKKLPPDTLPGLKISQKAPLVPRGLGRPSPLGTSGARDVAGQ